MKMKAKSREMRLKEKLNAPVNSEEWNSKC